MSQVLNKFEDKQKPTITHAQQILHGRIYWYRRANLSPIMRRMALNALSQTMGAKRKFGRLFGLGYDDYSAFGCMLIIARLVSLRRSLARTYFRLSSNQSTIISDPRFLLADSNAEKLRNFRDKALLLTLADTGLRAHEACNLRRGDVDWIQGRALVIGSGEKRSVVRFTTRAIDALKEYLALRSTLDSGSGKQLTSLPLFARHDKGAGKKIKPITPTTGRNIVDERVRLALDDQAKGNITPHSFRHYFVTTVLRGSGNLKLAQELARHKNIQVTQRYAHLSDDELDKGYYEIFEGKEK